MSWTIEGATGGADRCVCYRGLNPLGHEREPKERIHGIDEWANVMSGRTRTQTKDSANPSSERERARPAPESRPFAEPSRQPESLPEVAKGADLRETLLRQQRLAFSFGSLASPSELSTVSRPVQPKGSLGLLAMGRVEGCPVPPVDSVLKNNIPQFQEVSQWRGIPDLVLRSTPIQRDIQVKGGPRYANKGDLPEGIRDSVDLQNMADAAGTYLAKKSGDLTKRASNRESEILSPHRHLIGEAHNRSKFTKAIENWGWGADKMVEGFQTSTDVTDRITVENKALRGSGFFSNPYYQAKELENLHPFVIQSLSMLRFVLAALKEHAGAAKRCAGKIAENVNVSANKETFKQAEVMINNEESQAMEIWKDQISPHFDSYVDACEARLKNPRGDGNSSAALLYDMASAMRKKWVKMKSNIIHLSKKAYGFTDSWEETRDKLEARESNLKNFIEEGVDIWADHLVEMTKAEARVVSGDDSNDLAIDQGWATAKGAYSSKTAVTAIGPMREIFMQHNINSNLDIPGIVQIGADHVTNLDGKIDDGKYHASYEDFVADTKA